MRKIKWKQGTYSFSAEIGSIKLYCSMVWTKSGKERWYANVLVKSLQYSGREILYGRYRRTKPEKAQEDAVELARNYLLDMQAGLDVEMENFGLAMETCDA